VLKSQERAISIFFVAIRDFEYFCGEDESAYGRK